jgi:hypothetical protein
MLEEGRLLGATKNKIKAAKNQLKQKTKAQKSRSNITG